MVSRGVRFARPLPLFAGIEGCIRCAVLRWPVAGWQLYRRCGRACRGAGSPRGLNGVELRLH